MTESYCTFHLADLYLGIEVSKVHEVLRYQRMTRVPLVPPVVRGLMNLRGQIVTALDLRQRFGLPAADTEQQPLNVVVRSREGAVSLLVDRISDVIETVPQDFERAPETLRGVLRDFIRGAYKLKGQLLLILDTDRVIDASPQ
ncbi:MAG: chemotaxis protein CheW [Planctomycetaceae bacterium]